MADLFADLRLRPTRIAFLVRVSDFDQLKSAMRASVCVWGGMFNPIIPVLRDGSPRWGADNYRTAKNFQIPRGLIRFFEPDVYVEAESGLADKVGLAEFRRRQIGSDPMVVGLEQFLAEDEHTAEYPCFGLNVIDVMRRRYRNERRFQLRDGPEAQMPATIDNSAVTEVIFGAYPTLEPASHLSEAFVDVFEPSVQPPSVTAWRSVYVEGAETPLRLTREEIEVRRYWHHDPVVLVFNPSDAADVIYTWNRRLLPEPVLPVPVDWAIEVKDEIGAMIAESYRPVRGNPHGVMHHASLAFAPSISDKSAAAVAGAVFENIEGDARHVRKGAEPLWWRPPINGGPRFQRALITSKNSRIRLDSRAGDRAHRASDFDSLSPSFAGKYAGHSYRWANVLSLSWSLKDDIATVLPLNIFDADWPKIGSMRNRIGVTSEGWVILDNHLRSAGSIELLTPEDAAISWLSTRGIRAELSEPGRIAKDILANLGGMWGVSLLADYSLLKLLNDMAGGVRRRSDEKETVEQYFEKRSAAYHQLNETLKARNTIWSPEYTIANLTERNIVRLGVESRCGHCNAKNWHSIDGASYVLKCDRCLREYPFPQDVRGQRKPNWQYRVIGPFSVPDFARGSYSSLLAARVLEGFDRPSNRMTFSPSLRLEVSGKVAEVDFFAWYRDSMDSDVWGEVRCVVGETKSAGEKALKEADFERLRTVGDVLEGCVYVIATMKDSFDAEEMRLLEEFVNWCRVPNADTEPRHLVVLLTGHELFFEGHLAEEWKNKGAPYSSFADHFFHSNLLNFAEATQAIYLDMPGYYEWLNERGLR